MSLRVPFKVLPAATQPRTSGASALYPVSVLRMIIAYFRAFSSLAFFFLIVFILFLQQPCLSQDRLGSLRLQIQTRPSGDRRSSRLSGMLKLAMTSSLTNQHPAILAQFS